MGGRPGWRVGFAGLARAGAWRRLREWQLLESAELVAVADSDPRRRERAREMGVSRVYAEPRELLARETVDVLHAACGPMDQGSLVLSALMRGLDVLVEPPLAGGAAAARRLVTGARTYGSFLLPAWPAAFDPAWRGLVENRQAVGAPARLEARLVLGYEPWWDDLEEDVADDPRMPLPGAIALGADRLVHLALELFGTPGEVSARTDQDQLFGRSWEPRATLLLFYLWGCARLTVEIDLDREESGTAGGSGARLVLEGEAGRLQVNGRRLLLERFGGANAGTVLPMTGGPGARPPGRMIESLERAEVPSGSLSPDRLATVCQVVAALERSAAGEGKREPVHGPAFEGSPAGPGSVTAAAAPTSSDLDQEA